MQKNLKSILCLLLCVLLTATLPLAAVANAIGDVDGNGEVGTADARLALRAAIGLESYAKGSAAFKAADVDFNGAVETADARLILRAAIGLETLKEASHVHTWKSEAERVTGSNIGYHYLVCAECGEKQKENCAYGTERKLAPGSKVTEATCTLDATYYVECVKCAGKKIVTESKLNHPNKTRVAAKSKAADCTTAGYDWYECPLCKENGDTLKDLKVALPALGHSASTAADPINNDVVCTRCSKTITPSFNSLVNAIKKNASPTFAFSDLTKTDSSGEVKNYNIHIPDAAKTLMRLAGESLDEQTILEQFTSELNETESTYTGFQYKSPFFYQYYPIPFTNTVSSLTKDDVQSINIQEISSVDFMDEIPESVNLQMQSGTSRPQDLTEFRNIGAAMKGNIYKITVVLKQEQYSKIKDSTAETALQHAIGVDIRSYPENFSQNESEEGFDLKMTCSDVISNCTITYYFLVEGEGTDAAYTPLASKYVCKYDIDQHIDLKAGMPISELGIDSGILNTFLALTGMKQGEDIVFMEGSIDMKVSNTNTDFYLFSND
mgnify:CR=1 FL=1